MANFLQQGLSDNFIWDAIVRHSTATRKKNTGGSFMLNCPLCVSKGQLRPDRKFRLGIKNLNPGVEFHCFNCAAKGKYTFGSDGISRTLWDLMIALGVPEIEVKRLNHRARSYRRLIEASSVAHEYVPANYTLDFPSQALPTGARSFKYWADQGCTDPDFLDVVTYVLGRGEDIERSTSFHWSPETKYNMSRRVIVPFFHSDKTVGWTARLIDPPQMIGDRRESKYFNSDLPPDYLFNNHVMEDRDRKYIILMEGVFDALAIDGVASLGARLSDRQASWIDSMGKTVIVLPDHDAAGGRLIDAAVKRGWHVSLPLIRSGSAYNWWDADLKDAADAVKKYGRLYTLTSIIAASTQNKTEIAIKRKMMNI